MVLIFIKISKINSFFFKFIIRLNFNLATMLVLEHVDPKELLNLAFTIQKNEKSEKRSINPKQKDFG